MQQKQQRSPFLFHTFFFLVKASAYITYNATQLPTVGLEIQVCYASSC